MVFDIFGGGNDNGVRLIKYPKHGRVNQRFIFKRDTEGNYIFIAVNSGKDFGLWKNIIAQSTVDNSSSQTWILSPV